MLETIELGINKNKPYKLDIFSKFPNLVFPEVPLLSFP